MEWIEEQHLVKKTIGEFPEEFGLRARPGEKFKISALDSYYSQTYGVMLYTHVYSPERECWLAYAKGTPEELRRNML